MCAWDRAAAGFLREDPSGSNQESPSGFPLPGPQTGRGGVFTTDPLCFISYSFYSERGPKISFHFHIETTPVSQTPAVFHRDLSRGWEQDLSLVSNKS